jgi:hypothetical protein
MMPGDIADQAFKQQEPGRTHAFFANTNDKLFVSAIVTFIPGALLLQFISHHPLSYSPPISPLGINITSTTFLSPDSEKHEWQGSLEAADKLVALITPDSMTDVVLQQQIHSALDLSKDVVLIHDLREANEFSDILNVCPKELQDKGIFDHLAVALYGGDYQHISLQLLWQRLSADRKTLLHGRKDSNMIARNSEMPHTQKSFIEPMKGLSNNKVAPAPTSKNALVAEPKKQGEARLEELVAPAPTAVPKKEDGAQLEELAAAEENSTTSPDSNAKTES